MLCGFLSGIGIVVTLLLLAFLERRSKALARFIRRHKDSSRGIYSALLLALALGISFGAAGFMEESLYERMMTVICSMDPVCQTSKTSNL
jgi:hypothetical protein